ncbi:hypothetical protein KKH36_01930 [Patescibacteria group bacterium]|nr:hypothetical protein [Patescibacteria group bacterium]
MNISPLEKECKEQVVSVTETLEKQGIDVILCYVIKEEGLNGKVIGVAIILHFREKKKGHKLPEKIPNGFSISYAYDKGPDPV